MEEATPAPPPAAAVARLPVGANYKDGNRKTKKGGAPSTSPTAAAPNKDDIIIPRSNIVSPKRNQIVPPEKYHNWKRHLYNGCDEVRSISECHLY